jgi:hypothetical protein
VTVGDICPKGYKLPHEPRNTGQKGGGVGLLHKKILNINLQKMCPFYSFEYMESFLKTKTKCIRIIVLYRPPPSESNSFTNAIFLEEFAKFLEQQIVATGDLLIVGGFNFHVDNEHNYYAKRFLDLIDSFCLTQHVKDPTHVDGHTLDLVLTRTTDDIIQDLYVTVPTISDHSAIHFKLKIPKPESICKEIVYRKVKSIDREKFHEDITNSALVTSPSSSL